MRIFESTKNHGMVQYKKGIPMSQNNTKFVTKTTPIASAQALGILKKIPVEAYKTFQEEKQQADIVFFPSMKKKVCSTH